MWKLREPPAMVNIAGSSAPVDDPNYRYKMPLLQVVPGGKMGKKYRDKTIVVNAQLVAKSLHRDPGELSKYLGCKLATRATLREDSTVLLGGKYDAGLLQELIPGYVEIFVLCPTCHLPETVYEISKKKKCVYHKCSACGARNRIEDSDNKVCRYILSQNIEDSKKSEKKKKKRAEGGTCREGKSCSKANPETQSCNDGKEEIESESELEEWALGIAVHAVRKTIQERTNLPAEQLARFVIEECATAGLEEHMSLHILIRSSMSPETFLGEKEYVRYAPVISILTKEGDLGLERHLIAALEVVCRDASPKKLPIMLLKLYEEDALSEEAIIKWWLAGEDDKGDRYRFACVTEETQDAFRAEAEPLLIWLLQ